MDEKPVKTQRRKPPIIRVGSLMDYAYLAVLVAAVLAAVCVVAWLLLHIFVLN